MAEQGTATRNQEGTEQESRRQNRTSTTQRNQEFSGRESQELQARDNRARESYDMERRSQERGGYPSVFSVSPGEFFTMSPITLMRRFTEDIDRAFGFGASTRQPGHWEQELDWMPRVEVRQSGNDLVVHAELPGLNENDVHVEATNDGLLIEGERKREQEDSQGRWHRSEFSYGRFSRLIPLPENAKIDDARANFRNGVLEVAVPVPETENRRRQIPIRNGGPAQGSGHSSPSTAEGRSTASGTR